MSPFDSVILAMLAKNELKELRCSAGMCSMSPFKSKFMALNMAVIFSAVGSKSSGFMGSPLMKLMCVRTISVVSRAARHFLKVA